MTKLNYERPHFRYFDSLRREVIRQNRSPLEEDLPVPSDNVVFPKDAFPLTPDEGAVALRLFDAIGIHFAVEDEILQSRFRKNGLIGLRPLTPAQETARRGAGQKMQLAANAVAQRMLQSGLEGRLHLVVLFTDLQQQLTPLLWDLINNDLMKSAFQRLEVTVRSSR